MRRDAAQCHEHGLWIDEVLEHVVAADRVERAGERTSGECVLDRAHEHRVEVLAGLQRGVLEGLHAVYGGRARRTQRTSDTTRATTDIERVPDRER